MQKITPCIWFVEKGEEAVELYISTFKNSSLGKKSYYSDAAAEVSGMKKGSLMAVDFTVAGCRMQGLNGGPHLEHSPSLSLFVTCGSRAELDEIHQKLSPGGKTLMELGEYPFSKRYTFFSDKFGVHWQLFLEEGSQQKITPSVIFGGEKQGVGPKALGFYQELFPKSKVLFDDRYRKNENGIEGSVKHARIELDGSQLIIMDAGHNAPMKMTGAISLVVHCLDQKEVDHYWNALAKSGKEIQCGWIEDAFGVSWQIVPEGLESLLSGPDRAGAERAMQAMLKMKKLDIGLLKQAYENRTSSRS